MWEGREGFEIGDWRLEIGNWKLEIGEWRLENGEWRMESGGLDRGGLACEASS
jgi:hypothetical protein